MKTVSLALWKLARNCTIITFNNYLCKTSQCAVASKNQKIEMLSSKMKEIGTDQHERLLLNYLI